MEETPSKLVPALIGGSVVLVISIVPGLNCCAWITLIGIVGVFFYWRSLKTEHQISSGEGAIVGLLAGVFGGLFWTLVGYVIIVVLGLALYSGRKVEGAGEGQELDTNQMNYMVHRIWQGFNCCYVA